MWHDVKQNSEDPCPCCGKSWMELRAGKVTGSSIAKVMANYGNAFGEPAKKLAIKIAVHESGGRVSEDSFSNRHLERGHEQEPIARKLYEDTFFCDVSSGGFHDNGRTGVSPDGHVYADGLIEIKSVEEHAHYACIKRDGIDPAYKWQVIFGLKETQKPWLDYVSYCSYFPRDKQLFVCRLMYDDFTDKYQMIDERLKQFFKLVDEIKSDISKIR